MEPQLALLETALSLAVVLAIVLANGYFVAAEFALVAARRTQIDGLAAAGGRRARFARHAIRHLDRYISGSQVGITLASIALGWYGERTVAGIVVHLFRGVPEPFDVLATHAVAGTVALLAITYLVIVFGELVPKYLALLFPETTTLWISAPLVGFSRLCAPFIWVVNESANALLRIFGLRPVSEVERVHSPEEIAMLVRQSHEHGVLAEEPRAMIEGVFETAERTVEEVMTPRTDVVAVEADEPLERVADVLLREGHSRLPVYEGDLDHVVGIVLARDVWNALHRGEPGTLRELVRPPYFVPFSKRVQPLIAEMLRARAHLAVVVDEFGGTDGIVTLEDLLEEIVGEIRDEHEVEGPGIVPRGPGVYSVAAATPLDELEEELGIRIPRSEHYTTLGGYVLEALGRIPRVGDELPVPGGRIRVATMRGRRIVQVLLALDGSGGSGDGGPPRRTRSGPGTTG